MVILLAVCLVWSVTWWNSQRDANSRLLEQGQIVSAQVVDVDSGRTSSLTVRFAVEEGYLERDIHAGLSQTFPRGYLGQEISILFDPAHPELVRTPDGRNMHPLTIVVTFGAGVLLVAILAGIRSTLSVWSLLAATSWRRGELSSVARGRQQSPVVTLADTSTRSKLTSIRTAGVPSHGYLGKRVLFASNEKYALVIPDGSGCGILIRL